MYVDKVAKMDFSKYVTFNLRSKWEIFHLLSLSIHKKLGQCLLHAQHYSGCLADIRNLLHKKYLEVGKERYDNAILKLGTAFVVLYMTHAIYVLDSCFFSMQQIKLTYLRNHKYNRFKELTYKISIWTFMYSETTRDIQLQGESKLLSS